MGFSDGAPARGDAVGPVLHDPLTALPTWHLFSLGASAALARATRHGWSTAVLVVDLDRFYRVNALLGRDTGDAVLEQVARRLEDAFRGRDVEADADADADADQPQGPYVGAKPGDIVGHLGGDDFVILCQRVGDRETARTLGRRVAALLAPPIDLGDGEMLVSAGVGIAVTSPGQSDVEQLVVEAESAMRRSKLQARGAWTVFEPAMRIADRDHDKAGRDLHRALTGGELRLHYQPKVALDSDRIVGVEALLRWQDPRRGLVPPLEFIPLAEETGLIVPIGAWVIETACRQAAKWRRMFPDHPALTVSVNVSPRQFDAGLVDVVADALAASALPPEALCLEVTESIIMDDVQGSSDILAQLDQLGVRLSIDDFGTGYSSLAYLKRFPLHELKIDKSFIDGLGHDANDTAIVGAMVAMAGALNLWVVAEGVETADQLTRLRTLGCEQVQGYHIARPGPPETIDAMLHAEASASWSNHERQLETDASALPAFRPERVLVVDDSSDTREVVRISLSMVGFEIHEAIDGVSGLNHARLIDPDCILLDLRMAGMDGTEVCRAMRAGGVSPQCAILILTGADDASDKVDAFSAGADDYIVKPFSPRDLAARVHGAIRRRRQRFPREADAVIVTDASPG